LISRTLIVELAFMGHNTKVSSAVHATYPVTDRILLPEAIIGTDIPLTLAPAPVAVVVDIGPDSDSPDADHGKMYLRFFITFVFL
ncbi:hypothetical protein HAX54_005896, partial [Datura stramonium]|nr:hypothetical protein [Datura stramonium]